MTDRSYKHAGEGADPGAGVCSRCQGTGFVIAVEDGVERAFRCPCRRRPDSGRISLLDIPLRFRHCAIDDSPDGRGFISVTHPSLEIARGVARRFVRDYPAERQGLLFMGRCGVGKTHLAVAILRELALTKGVTGRFCDFHELLRRIRESYNPVSGTSEMELLQPILGAEPLVLDDLGAEKPSPWVQDTLHFIINQRYLRQRTTLITTNYLDGPPAGERVKGPHPGGEESLAERIGHRLRSRLFEMCRVVPMDGPDYREALGRC